MAAHTTLELYSLLGQACELAADSANVELDCLAELRAPDLVTGVQFRECRVDYTQCPNDRCVKRLV